MVIRKRKEREYPIRYIVCKCVAVCIFPLSVEEKVENLGTTFMKLRMQYSAKEIGSRNSMLPPPPLTRGYIAFACLNRKEGRGEALLLLFRRAKIKLPHCTRKERKEGRHSGHNNGF